MLEKIRKAYNDFCLEYDRQPKYVYMSESAYKKVKNEAKQYIELPCLYVARCFGTIIMLIEAQEDIAFFGTLAIGNPITKYVE